MSKLYVLNRETKKIQLQFDKASYQALSESDKKALKSAFLFSGKLQSWVSRSTRDHYSAIRVATQLGFTDGGKIGESLSFAEEVERQSERAEARQERYENKANQAIEKGKVLQSAFSEAAKDWSFVTQPIIRGHRGSEAFGRRRQQLLNRYGKGFEEYRKSEYYKERAIKASKSADMKKYEDASYLYNRIEECNKNIRQLEKSISNTPEDNIDRLERLLESLEYEIDKLAFMTNKLDEIGGIKYNKNNLKVGYLVNISGSWGVITKLKPKTLDVKYQHVNYSLNYNYADIKDIIIPENFTEEREKPVNPYQLNEILISTSIDGKRILYAFMIIKKTNRMVELQEIEVVNNVPQSDMKCDKKPFKTKVHQDNKGDMGVYYRGWTLSKYVNETVAI